MRAVRTLRHVAAVVSGMAVAACGMVGEKKPPPPCPPIFVLKDAGKLRSFKPGPGRDLTDVSFDAEIVDFRAVCVYSKDKSKANISLTLVFEILRGPANADRKAEFTYFVAIPKFHPAPQGKNDFRLAGEFPENSTRLRAGDEVRLQIPFIAGEPLDDYAVYLGFQLTREQLDYNRQGAR